MKTIGMLGGMSWESTASYYKLINEGVRERLGGLHSAKICMYSVDFEEIEKLQHRGNWGAAGKILSDAAGRIQAGGADFLIICTNTMHKVASQIEEAVSIPILHIADATAEELIARGVQCVGLLGTSFTMQQEFYKGRIAEKYGIEVLVPSDEQQQVVHDIIYSELCRGTVLDTSREYYLQIIRVLSRQGVEAIVLGCTEIGLLVQQQHTSIPLYDTTSIHANRAVEMALSD